MPSELTSVKGFRDLLPPESERMTKLEFLARVILLRYGFQELRLPTLEQQELFVKATGETTDIVEKEMFQLEDQGGRKLALRPEGTPGAVRAFLNHHLSQAGGVSKLFYIGNMFRAERPQAGRYREFEQIGAEFLGNPHPVADVESILSLKRIFDDAGLGGKTRLRLNNIGCDDHEECRPRYRNDLRSYLQARIGDLCENCQRRIARNPLRALDCKKDAPKLSDAPKLQPCGDCSAHFDHVRSMLEDNGFEGLTADSTLVRGLDYYTRTVFEFQGSGIGSQDALAGGGRYDGLVKSMGGPATPAVGWALGVERTLLAVAAVDAKFSTLNKSAPALTPAPIEVFVAVQNQENRDAANLGINLLYKLRNDGVRTEGGLFSSSLKAQLREAGRRQARFAVILGDQELAKSPKRCILKDMTGGEQREIDLETVADAVKA